MKNPFARFRFGKKSKLREMGPDDFLSVIRDQEHLIQKLSHQVPSFAKDPEDEFDSSIESEESFDTRAQQSKEAFLGDGFSFRAITMTASQIVRRNLSITSQDENIQSVFDGIFADPKNCWLLRLKELLHRLKEEGEGYWLGKMNPNTGQVRILEIPPQNILEKITPKHEFLNPCGAEKYKWVEVWKEFDDQGNGIEQEEEQIFTQFAENSDTKTIDFITEIRNPTLSHIRRGIGVIYPALRWIKLLRKFTNAVIQRGLNYAQLLWHVTVKEKSRGDIEKIRNRARPPRGPIVKVTSESENWEPKSPQGVDSKAAEDLRQVRLTTYAPFGTSEGIATGDNSNNNFASSKTGMQEAKVQAESDQILLEQFLSNFFCNIIFLLALHGIIGKKITIEEKTFEILKGEDEPFWPDIKKLFQITFPPVQEDSPEDTINRIKALIAANASQTTLFEAVGLDPEKEKARLKVEADERRKTQGDREAEEFPPNQEDGSIDEEDE